MKLGELFRMNLVRHYREPGYYVVLSNDVLVTAGKNAAEVVAGVDRAIDSARAFGEPVPHDFDVEFVPYGGGVHPHWYTNYGQEAPSSPTRGSGEPGRMASRG